MRQHGQRCAECDQISWIRSLVADLTDQTLEVIDRRKIFSQFFPADRIVF